MNKYIGIISLIELIFLTYISYAKRYHIWPLNNKDYEVRSKLYTHILMGIISLYTLCMLIILKSHMSNRERYGNIILLLVIVSFIFFS